MKKLAGILALLLALVGGGVVYYFYAQQGTPSALVGVYSTEEGGPVKFRVTTSGGGYYLSIDGAGQPMEQLPMIPMTMEDQTRIGGNTVNTELVGLKLTQGTLMIFKVGRGWDNWGKTFTSGYGSYGGPFSHGVEVLYRK